MKLKIIIKTFVKDKRGKLYKCTIQKSKTVKVTNVLYPDQTCG